MKSLCVTLNLNTEFTQSHIRYPLNNGDYVPAGTCHYFRGHNVRVYYFCSETGIYQGEGFQEELQDDADEGITAITPPPYQPGEVPVFDLLRKCWTVQSVHDRTIIHENRS